MGNLLKDDAPKRAKEYLHNHGIKQSWLANKMGISEPVLSGRLNGRYKFDVNFAVAFSKALNISPSIFLK